MLSIFKLFKLVKLLVPILILNWIVAEADLVMPGTKDATFSAFKKIQIPTHNKWNEDFSFNDISEHLQDFFTSVEEDGFKAAINEKIESASYDVSYNMDISNLKINPDDIYNDKDLFASLNTNVRASREF